MTVYFGRAACRTPSLRLSDSLEEYQPMNTALEELGDSLSFIILQRKAADKEFTEYTVYPPFGDDDGFPPDFEGIDTGESKMYLRCDLMRLLPDHLCAASLEEADYLIIAEDLYVWEGTLIVSNYDDNGSGPIPEFNDTEEMLEYFATHQREVSSMTYYPKFGSYAMISLYDVKTQAWTCLDITYFQARRFARNPGASDHWNDMIDLTDLIAALEADSGAGSVKDLIEGYDFVSDSDKSLWTDRIDENDYAAAAQSVSDRFWTMAGELKMLDPSEKNRENYDLIISDRNIALLAQYVNYCDYSGFDQSIESIRDQKEYFAAADPDWFESALKEIIGWFSN